MIILVVYPFAQRTPGVKLSCKEGKILGFGKMSMPIMCAYCIPNCEASVEVRNIEGEVVCSNSYKEDEVVIVPCPDLKKYKNGEELKVNYEITSFMEILRGIQFDL